MAHLRYVSMDDEDNIDPDKLEELKSCFGSFDNNGDGTISASEFQNALIRMNIYISPDDVKEIINAYDEDGSASLDFAEFLMLTAKLDPRIGQEIEINKAFKLFDKDQDGYITRKELVDALMRFGIEITEDMADDMFSTTDDNADGMITHKEFRNILYDAIPPPTINSIEQGSRSPKGSRSPRGARSPQRAKSPTQGIGQVLRRG